MRITILDSFPLNSGDLSWSELEKLGEVTIHERTSPAEVEARIADADVVLTNKVKLGDAHFEIATKVKYVGVLATGFDNIDVEAATQWGIAVCNVPSYSARFTAQTAIALMLELAQRIGLHSEAVRAGKWSKSADFSFWETPQVELAGKTLAIIGLGTIGGHVAQVARALGMEVVTAALPGREGPGKIPLDEALARADVVSLHCPLKPETRGLVGETFLSKLKASAFLVNTARGALVDDAALARALENGTIAGFAGDVLAPEPPPSDNPLLRAPNCLLTPHLGWSSFESRQRCLNLAVANVAAWRAGTPQNVVN